MGIHLDMGEKPQVKLIAIIGYRSKLSNGEAYTTQMQTQKGIEVHVGDEKLVYERKLIGKQGYKDYGKGCVVGKDAYEVQGYLFIDQAAKISKIRIEDMYNFMQEHKIINAEAGIYLVPTDTSISRIPITNGNGKPFKNKGLYILSKSTDDERLTYVSFGVDKEAIALLKESSDILKTFNKDIFINATIKSRGVTKYLSATKSKFDEDWVQG